MSQVLHEATSSGHGEPELQAIKAPVRDQLLLLDSSIERLLQSDTDLIGAVSSHIIAGRGKRIRPTLLLLAASALEPHQVNEDAIAMAAVVEFIHGATLLHDDVVDASTMRRGKPTANQRWGNETSVLVGDFLYSRAFQVMVRHIGPEAMAVMARTTNKIAEGEVRQLVSRNSVTLDPQAYLGIIEAKTACLFSAAAELGAMVAGSEPDNWQRLADYGMATGMAYQLVDDVLDYDANLAETGKNPGDDLRNGRMTMPLLHALRHDDGRLGELLAAAQQDSAGEIISLVRASGAIEHTLELAESYASKARQSLSGLPGNDCVAALHDLAKFTVARRF